MEVADVLPGSPGLEIVMMQEGNYNPYGGIAIEGKIQIVGKDPFLGYNRLMTISLGQDLFPTDFRFGDFNEDGRTDILINGAHLMVLLATASGFAPAQDIPFQHLGNLLGASARVGDVNGDGHLDLVLVQDEYSNDADVNDGDVITVLDGDGKGQFHRGTAP